ncbi:MAG: phage major capsid protein [Euryarchaeota archaeon]
MSLYSSSSAFAKDVWLPGLNYELLAEPGTLLGWLGSYADSRVTVDIEGRRSYIKLRIGDSLGQASISQGGDFPDPGDPTYDEASMSLAHLAHAISFTMEEMALLESTEAAAVPIMAEKMNAAKEAMSSDIERQAWGDGTGVLANVASSSGSTITLDATTTSQVDRDRYLWIDDANRARYDVVHGTTGAQQVTGFTVSDINETTNVLTCSATMTSATSAGVVVRSGTWASGGAYNSLEMPGIKAAVDNNNTYMGIDRTASGKGYWQSVVDDNSGTLRPLTEELIHGVMNKIARRAGRQPTGDYAAFGSFGTYTAYHQIITPGLRYTLESTPDIGFGRPLEMLGVPLYRGARCPRNQIYVLKKDSLKFVRPKHNKPGDLLNFVNLGGSEFFLKNASSGQGHSASVVAYLDGFLGMMTTRPRDHAVLGDITEVAGTY